MINFRVAVRGRGRLIAVIVIIGLLLAWLMLRRLGSLTGGLSAGEVKAASSPVGWHGIYHNPLYLPLKLVRSVVFYIFTSHGRTLTRLPNALFGVLTVVTFAALIRLWHSSRVAIMTGLLFATSAWVLHVSRLASFDVLYLWTLPTLLLVNALLYRYSNNAWAWYGGLIALGLLLYVPGMIWLIVANLFFLKKQIIEGWQHFSAFWQRALFIVVGLAWLPLLLLDLTRTGQLRLWLGLPTHFSTVMHQLKLAAAVPVHLFIRGPQYPDVWLGKAMILDIFTLVICLIGIYFYVTHIKAGRSRLLITFAVVGWLLIALGGPVGLSLLVPLLYVSAATGIAYLLHDWLHVFPANPIARGLGVGLISLAVVLACFYNLRAYFVAWPHNPTAQATFQYRR